jgi:hypothetical protein
MCRGPVPPATGEDKIHSIFAYNGGMNSDGESKRRVLMQFMDRTGWHVSFLESDCQTALPLKLTFATEAKIRTMHQRFGSPLLEDQQAFERGLSIGRGGVWLTLNEQQYERLKRTR